MTDADAALNSDGTEDTFSDTERRLRRKIDSLSAEVSALKEREAVNVDFIKQYQVEVAGLKSEVGLLEEYEQWFKDNAGVLASHGLGGFAFEEPINHSTTTTSTLQTVKDRIADPQIVDVDLEDL